MDYIGEYFYHKGHGFVEQRVIDGADRCAFDLIDQNRGKWIPCEIWIVKEIAVTGDHSEKIEVQLGALLIGGQMLDPPISGFRIAAVPGNSQGVG